MIRSIEAMHLLPAKHRISDGHSSSPVAVRFFWKSLPHLLPRRAFSFSARLVFLEVEIRRTDRLKG
jgi:hypothetical protein